MATRTKFRLPRAASAPVVPEIAKAYQNDPATLLARGMVQNGTSTAPVAQGGWGYADGIARALQGMAGTYVDKKQMERYKHGDAGAADPGQFNPTGELKPGTPEYNSALIKWGTQQNGRGEDGVLAQRQQAALEEAAIRRQEAAAAAQANPQVANVASPTPATAGPEGTPAQAPPAAQAATPAPNAPPAAQEVPNAAPVATALLQGGPTSPPGNPGIAPATHTTAMGANGVVRGIADQFGYQGTGGIGANAAAKLGGGDASKIPFSAAAPSGAGSAFKPNTAIGQQALPDEPTPLERPNAPQSVGPTRSRLLDAAYRTMMLANPYESAGGQDMYREGLSDQTKLDETAAERQQEFRKMGYQTDLGMYADSDRMRRQSQYAERERVQQNNFTAGQSQLTRIFEAGEHAKERGFQHAENGLTRAHQTALQNNSQQWHSGENTLQRAHELELEALKRRDRVSAYLSTKDGRKQYQADLDAIGNADKTIGTLDAFEEKLKTTKTGGVIAGNIPGLVRWANKDYQELEALTNELVLNTSKDMKGSLSDKDVLFLRQMQPNIRNGRGANRAQIARLRSVAQRQKEFVLAKNEALANGEGMQFMQSWSAYSSANPAGSGKDYNTWRSTLPAYDASGNPVKR